MKILVTGGTGFLGSHLVPRLAAAGHQVRVVARNPPVSRVPRVEYLQGDLQEPEVVEEALDGIQALYHLAGRVSFRGRDGRKMFELHVEATRRLLEQLKASGQKPRVILGSTSGTVAVFKEERIGTEADDYALAVVARWPYYLSKLYEEKQTLELCQEAGIPLVVLNPSLLLGPGDERLSSTWIISKFLNRDIPAMPNGGLSFVDVRDAADAFVAALTRGELYGRHLLGVNLSFSELMGRLERLTGVPAPRVKLPSRLNVLGAHLLDGLARVRGSHSALDPQEVEMGEHFFYLDAAKAQALLGFEARDTQETLLDTVQDLLQRMPPGHLPGVAGRMEKLLRPPEE